MLKDLLQSIFKTNNLSFSQCGEDRIVKFLFNLVGIHSITYLDIGCHHPIIQNNTFLFYTQGSRGILVEPNKNFQPIIKKSRKGDVFLPFGVGNSNVSKADFFILSDTVLSTFLPTEVNVRTKKNPFGNQFLKEKTFCKIIDPQTLINNYIGFVPDFWSIDTEGMDEKIIKAVNFKTIRPKVICVETAQFIEKGKVKKNNSISNYLSKHGYFIYADTFINTIFVDKDFWSTYFS